MTATEDLNQRRGEAGQQVPAWPLKQHFWARGSERQVALGQPGRWKAGSRSRGHGAWPLGLAHFISPGGLPGSVHSLVCMSEELDCLPD